MYKVLLLDDESLSLNTTKDSFDWSKYNFEVAALTTNPYEAIDIIYNQKIHVVFVDNRMPGISGFELKKIVNLNNADIEFVMISGFAEFDCEQESNRQGVFDYCLKPIRLDYAEQLLMRLSVHLNNKQISNNKKLRQSAHYNIENTGATDSFNKLLIYIRKNYNSKLLLKELALLFHINTTYCCELFKKVTGDTFSHYLTNIRMQKAAELLIHTHLSLEKVYSEIGYNDYHYFFNVFKKHFHTTPSMYRKEYANYQN